MYTRIMLLRNWQTYLAVAKVHVDHQTAKNLISPPDYSGYTVAGKWCAILLASQPP